MDGFLKKMSKCTGHKFILLPPSHYTMGQYRVGWSETIEIFEKFKSQNFRHSTDSGTVFGMTLALHIL